MPVNPIRPVAQATTRQITNATKWWSARSRKNIFRQTLRRREIQYEPILSKLTSSLLFLNDNFADPADSATFALQRTNIQAFMLHLLRLKFTRRTIKCFCQRVLKWVAQMKSSPNAFRSDNAIGATARALPRAFWSTTPFKRSRRSSDLGHEVEVMRALTLAVPISLALWALLIAAVVYLF